MNVAVELITVASGRSQTIDVFLVVMHGQMLERNYRQKFIAKHALAASSLMSFSTDGILRCQVLPVSALMVYDSRQRHEEAHLSALLYIRSIVGDSVSVYAKS